MQSPEKDKAFLEAGIQQLEPYLLSRDLYRLSASPTTDFTQITLGALLLARARLKGWGTPGVMEMSMQMDAARLQWRAAWDAKALREIRARTELWKNYLVEAERLPAESARKYPYEVRLRVILSLLMDEVPTQSEESLSGLDGKLRAIWKPGKFAWDSALESVFPGSTFWFLYGTINTGE